MSLVNRIPVKIGVLVSGNGSNLQSVIDSIKADKINAVVCCVISNNPEAFAVTRAYNSGIPVVIHENRSYSCRKAYDAFMVNILRDFEVELVVLAGFMRILSEVMINSFPNAIMNIHPALLPAFPGLHAQRQALDYGVKYSGCTVHFVDCGTDTGPIILQTVVPVEQGDNEDSLSRRIQKAEHLALPTAIKLFVNQRLKVTGRLVRIIVD